MFDTDAEHRINHIALSEIADVIVIAPATANIMAKIAGGIADDMLTTTVLATRAPVIIAPAMHTAMWENPITQENSAKLMKRGFYIIEPAVGRLASGGFGPAVYRILRLLSAISKKYWPKKAIWPANALWLPPEEHRNPLIRSESSAIDHPAKWAMPLPKPPGIEALKLL